MPRAKLRQSSDAPPAEWLKAELQENMRCLLPPTRQYREYINLFDAVYKRFIMVALFITLLIFYRTLLRFVFEIVLANFCRIYQRITF